MFKKAYIYDHVRLTPDKQIGSHVNDTWELSYVVTGGGIRTIGDQSEPFSAGDLVLIPPGIPHCWSFSPDMVDRGGMIENMTVIIREEFLERVVDAFPVMSSAVVMLREITDAVAFTGDDADVISSLLFEMSSESEEGRAVLMLRLLKLLSECGQGRVVGRYLKPDLTKLRLSKIRIYLSCNFRRRITIDEISDYTGMNRSAFCVFFRRHTGKTFVGYLNELRVEEAARLLASGHSTVTEACFASGFNDLAYFSRTFRRLKGAPPSSFRR